MGGWIPEPGGALTKFPMKRRGEPGDNSEIKPPAFLLSFAFASTALRAEEVGIWDVATRETGTQLIVISRPELALGT